MTSIRPLTCLSRLSAIPTTTITTSTTQTSRRLLHHSSRLQQKPTLTDSLRKKIWGTDAPPGAADPYQRQNPIIPQQQEVVEEEEVVDEVEKQYIPDTDARAMIIVGTRGNFMQREWDESHPVEIYKTKTPVRGKKITLLTRRAVIEVYSEYLASKTTNDESTNTTITKFTKPKIQKPTVKIDIERSKSGEFQLFYSSKDVMMKAASKKYDAQIYLQVSDRWRALPLVDADLKFALMKRIRELTGLTIPDPVISQQKTVADLLSYLNRHKSPEYRTNTAEMLTHYRSPIAQKLRKNPNISISTTRIRPTQRERAIGRTETIDIIMAGLPRQPGEKNTFTENHFKRRRKLLGLGIHGIDTYPEAKRQWTNWLEEVVDEDGKIAGEEDEMEVEEDEGGDVKIVEKTQI